MFWWLIGIGLYVLIGFVIMVYLMRQSIGATYDPIYAVVWMLWPTLVIAVILDAISTLIDVIRYRKH